MIIFSYIPADVGTQPTTLFCEFFHLPDMAATRLFFVVQIVPTLVKQYGYAMVIKGIGRHACIMSIFAVPVHICGNPHKQITTKYLPAKPSGQVLIFYQVQMM